MKKLFVSCPMKGRTEENIKNSIEKMHKIAEIVFEENLELIDSYIPKVPTTGNEGVWMLGRSIQMLAEADYFIGIDSYSAMFSGCMIEGEVARKYGIRSVYVRMADLMPDAVELEREIHEVTCKPI